MLMGIASKGFWSGFVMIGLTLSACVGTKQCVTQDDSKWMLRDSTVCKAVGDSLMEVLFKPDTVKWHRLHYQENSTNLVPSYKGYVRDSSCVVLTDRQTAVLQYLLFGNVNNYTKDSTLIQSPHIPQMEFELIKNGMKNANVVISVSDKNWSVFYDGKNVVDGNYVNSRIVEDFCTFFSKTKKNR